MTRRIFALAAVMSVMGCTLNKQGAPALTGPSELALSLYVTATPDVITQDGVSQSTIQVLARDANNQAVPGLGLRVATLVGGQSVDFGILSTKAVTTGGDGRATVTYTAPPAPPDSVGTDPVVTIDITPIGNSYANVGGHGGFDVTREAKIRLTKPGQILPPNGTPLARFNVSPTTPREGDRVNFDGSISLDDGQIVAWDWNFGDGDSASGPQVSNRYELAGSYNVTLTVTDDRGLRATSAPFSLTVASADAPEAEFTSSPSSPTVGTLVVFDGRLSTATAGRTITSYEWNFGDGSPLATGEIVNHVFTAAGTYNVVLKVTDDAGKTHSVSATVTVS